MRKFWAALTGLVLICSVPFITGQTVTLPGMTESTTFSASDILWIVRDPGGTPLSRKITASNLLGGAATLSRQFPMAGIISGTAASIWSLPAISACVPATKATSANTIGAVLSCADGETAEVDYLLEANWTGAIDATLVLAGGGSDTSGTIIPTIAIACAATNGTVIDDPSYNTADNMSTITLATAANRMWTSVKTGITTTGCTAGALMHIKIGRATDTAVSRAHYKTLLLTVRRTP